MKSNLLTTHYLLLARKGQAALTLVLVVGAIVLIAGLTLLFLLISFTNSTYGLRAANRALAVATAGVEDMLIRIVRDVSFSGCTPQPTCTVMVGNDTATVTVTNAYATTTPGSTITIDSEAGVLTARRKVRVVLSVDAATGRINTVSWGQVSF